MRSSAKPFQALPFVEHGGVEHYGFTDRELALACASHEGSAAHLETVRSMQAKAGLDESLLQCGVHLPSDPENFRAFVASGGRPTANFNNCSGKHTAMLAHAKMRGLPLENYLDPAHLIQQEIVTAFAEMAPYVLVAGLGGPLVDHIGARRVAIWSNAIAAALEPAGAEVTSAAAA